LASLLVTTAVPQRRQHYFFRAFNVANWIRFSRADGVVGFGTLSEDGLRVML
jgi:hypothetical protein